MTAFSDIFIGGSAVENSFESLDYIYMAAPDFDAAVRFYTSTLGGSCGGASRTGTFAWRRFAWQAWDRRCC
jgi:hypothetical protein